MVHGLITLPMVRHETLIRWGNSAGVSTLLIRFGKMGHLIGIGLFECRTGSGAGKIFRTGGILL